MSEDRSNNAGERRFGEYTYTMATPPEPAWVWRDYERIVRREWQEILSSDPAEKEMHEFFERHPCMLPGAHEIAGGESGHSPWFAAVISKPPLPSYGARIPDFMWLANHSLADVPVLIEIEAPGKKWFRKNGQPTAEFTQAHDQLKEWQAWFASTRNIESFRDFYGLPQRIDLYGYRSFTPQFVLVYGRRTEAIAKPLVAQKRAHMQGSDELLMTYDRLSPDSKCDDLMCARRTVEGFTAVTVPPTITLGPAWAVARSKIGGKAEAVERNRYLSEVRKRFLLERLPYWDEWARRDDQGTINLGHFE